MKKLTMQFFSVLLALCLLLSAAPVTVFGATVVASGNYGDNITWTLDSNGLLTVSGEGKIPWYSKEKVPWYSIRTSIRSVKVLSGVLNTGYYAFMGCTSLTGVDLADSVTEISDQSFRDCTSLTHITLPDTVTEIGAAAFQECSNLQTITIPYGVEEIQASAFKGCTLLVSVKLPNTLEWIQTDAFRNCSSLSEIVIPSSVTRLDFTCFCNCSGLKKLKFLDCDPIICTGAFSGCTALEEITVDSNNKNLHAKGNCLIDTDRKELILGCKTSVIPTDGSVTTIGESAFAACSELTHITIPNQITSILNSAFSGCSGLKSIIIPPSMQEITPWTFSSCSNLESVTIPDSVKVVGRNAFYQCEALKDVYYLGARKDWENVSIDEYNEPLQNAALHCLGFTVTYDANGGSGAPEPQDKEADIELTLSTTKPAKSYILIFNANGGSVSTSMKSMNCTFVNWNTAKDGSGTPYNPGGSYTANEDATLYAQWKDPAVGDLPTPTLADYHFLGWFTADDGGERVDSSFTISEDTMLYAHWGETVTFTVSYDANGGTGAPDPQTKTEDEPLTLSSAKPTKSYTLTFNANGGSVTDTSKTVSCTFKNWNTAKNGAGTSYNPGDVYAANADATLYAQWTDPTAGDLPTPTRTGFHFMGWFTATSGGSRVTSSSTVSADTKLYAQWTEVKVFTVSYDAVGGTGAPDAQTKIEDQPLTLSSAKPTKSYTLTFNANGGSVTPAGKTLSCTFKNWNTAKNASGTSYNPGDVYTANADATLYAQWTNPKAGDLPTPVRDGYNFTGWYTATSGGSKVTSSSGITGDTVLYARWTAAPAEPDPTEFTWGVDNWNFYNSSATGDFRSGTYREQINSAYLNALKNALNNSEYQKTFVGSGSGSARLDKRWGGSCYGMSSLTLLANLGYLPYSQYKAGAATLNELDRPTSNENVSSLITYYQMLQIKEVIQQQYRTVPQRSNETNVKAILSLLDENPTVLVCFKKDGWGGHAILAYGYEYGSYTYNGVTYQGCIKICDPNNAKEYDPNYNIYFNTRSYQWAIPAYSAYEVTSAKGACFMYVGANVNAINSGGYLSAASAQTAEAFVARIDAYEIGATRSVAKVQTDDGVYMAMASAPGDIVEDYSYDPGSESAGTAGYNLMDADAAYMVTQADPVSLSLDMDYETCDLSAYSAAGRRVIFDNRGYVEVQGESAAYTLSLIFDEDYPTDWFAIEVSGSGADRASLEKAENGFILTSDVLTDVTVKANNREQSATLTFSSQYPSVLIYEIDPNTVGVRVDTNGDGIYETELADAAVLPGDVDGDGKITASDARLALRRAVDLETYAEGSPEFLACDIDRDGNVTASDARIILRIAVDLESVEDYR